MWHLRVLAAQTNLVQLLHVYLDKRNSFTFATESYHSTRNRAVLYHIYSEEDSESG